MWLLRRTGPWWNESTGTVIAQFREIASISNCVVTNRLLYTLNFHQENVEMSIKTNNKGEIEHRLVGFVQLGTLHDDMRKWEGNNIFRKNRQRASRVFKLMHLSDSGFTFPVAQFPSHDLTATDLYDMFGKEFRWWWKIISRALFIFVLCLRVWRCKRLLSCTV